MLVHNLSYFDLVMYVIFLCGFIPMWVFLVLGFQVFDTAGSVVVENENNVVELLWTVVPTLMVGVLCYLNVQYMVGDVSYRYGYPYKVVGHQWFWSYESADGNYDSYMGDFIDSVEKPARFVWGVPYKLYVTSADVLHSFSVPDYLLKVDAIPGRINYVSFFPDRVGVFVGYCSELCGVGHSYMPIVLEVVYRGKFNG